MSERTAVVVIRHPRERISKCSLRTLHDRCEFTFLKAAYEFTFDATDHILLSVDAEPLSATDRGHPLLILDSTWRLLPRLEARLTGEPIRRSIPSGIQTAYPRASRTFEDPKSGLASVEAVYIALRILGEDDPTLLDNYHWKEQFLEALDQ